MNAFATRLATCFGIGYIPLAPGTAASLAALPLGWGFAAIHWQALAIATAFATLAGVWASGVYARAIGVKDPSDCVIDEVAGQWLSLLPIALQARAHDWRSYAMALFLFRVFDMWKPWPVSAVERLPGGLGIMADDVMAGVIAAGVLYGMLYIQLV